jgi:hypothetical protein
MQRHAYEPKNPSPPSIPAAPAELDEPAPVRLLSWALVAAISSRPIVWAAWFCQKVF